MFSDAHFRGSRAILLDPVDAAPWLGSGPDVPAGQWAGHDPVLRDDDRTINPVGGGSPGQTPPVLWVVGNVDLTAHRLRDAPEPFVCADGQVISWEFDATELSTVHLQPCPASTGPRPRAARRQGLELRIRGVDDHGRPPCGQR